MARYTNSNEALKAVYKSGLELEHVDKSIIDNTIALIAVAEEGMALKFVEGRIQTEEICLAAVINNPNALQYVENQTESIVLLAIKKDPRVLEFVIDQSIEACVTAIDIDPYIGLYYTRIQTPSLCLFALKKSISVFELIDDPTEEMIDYVKEVKNKEKGSLVRSSNSILNLINKRSYAVMPLEGENINNVIEYIYGDDPSSRDKIISVVGNSSGPIIKLPEEDIQDKIINNGLGVNHICADLGSPENMDLLVYYIPRYENEGIDEYYNEVLDNPSRISDEGINRMTGDGYGVNSIRVPHCVSNDRVPFYLVWRP